MGQHADRFRDYVHRNYEAADEPVDDVVAAFFAEDFVYDLGDTTQTRQAIAATARAIRATPDDERLVEMTPTAETEDTVTVRMHLRLRNAATGELDDVRVATTFTFDDDGMIVRAEPSDPATTGQVLRDAAGG